MKIYQKPDLEVISFETTDKVMSSAEMGGGTGSPSDVEMGDG